MRKPIFARNVDANGSKFVAYTTRLTFSKTGETVAAKVKFRQPCKGPAKDICPCVIDFEKTNANLVQKGYTNNAGEQRTSYTLWISDYTLTDEVYVDHSLDDIE